MITAETFLQTTKQTAILGDCINMSGNTSGLSSSPWGKIHTPTPQSLSEVMSEELVAELQHEEENPNKDPEIDMSKFMTSDDLDTSNDLLMAQMLQHEFDKDYDREIQMKEDKVNSQSKVRVSYQNYRAVHPSLWDEEMDPEEVEEIPDPEEERRNFRGRGISGKGKNIVTKHDPNIWGQRHADRMMDQFPPEMNTGDAIGMETKLPNRVYNKLKTHTKAENKRTHRVHEKKEHSTAEHAMDPKTRLILYKLVNNGTLEDVNGIISTGKESVVFHAQGGSAGEIKVEGSVRQVPPEIAIKVFKTTLTDFKNRADYVKGDVRFFPDELKSAGSRKFLGMWADKEVANLRRMQKYNVTCPRVILQKRHVLVMEFIGENQVAAPKLKDAQLNTADIQIAYEQCVKNLKTMYRDCQLVHSDLSEYNMLWHKDTLYFIDVSQSVDWMHPHAHEFLLRDCKNVCQFFKKKGAVGVPNEFDLFNEVTGMGLRGEGHDFLMQVEEYEKNEDKLRTGKSAKNYPFDFFFEHATKQREMEKRVKATENAENETETGDQDDRLSGDVNSNQGDRLSGNSEDDYSSSEDSDEDGLLSANINKPILTVEKKAMAIGEKMSDNEGKSEKVGDNKEKPPSEQQNRQL